MKTNKKFILSNADIVRFSAKSYFQILEIRNKHVYNREVLFLTLYIKVSLILSLF